MEQATTLEAAATAECERFLRESGFYARLEREAEGVRIQSALYSAGGYCLTRIEHVPAHGLLIVRGSRAISQEPRPVPRIRRALLTAFRVEGFHLRPELLNVRFAGRNVLVSAGILES